MTRAGTREISFLHLGTGSSVCLIHTKERSCTLTGCITSGEVCWEDPQIRFWGFRWKSVVAFLCQARKPQGTTRKKGS